MDLPNWLPMNSTEYKEIEEAVREAEKQTSGEIVPIVLRRSSTVGHIPLVLLLFFILIYLFVFSEFLLDSPFWTGGVLILAWLLSRFLASWSFLQRVLTPKGDQAAQVEQRAELEFYHSHIQKTEGQTGILLLLSLMERRAVVLADKAIADKLPAETWQEVCDLMTSGIKNRKLSAGLCQGIAKSGELLAEHFPILPDDENELPNQLIIKEF